jgi:hypothetical protein
MLLLYRVEGCHGEEPWETIRVCRPSYKKTETLKTERYGFLKRKKRTVVASCVIHNAEEAIEIAYMEALKHYYLNSGDYSTLRITVTSRIKEELVTRIVLES